MPNIAKDGLKFVKARARRHDTVGEATYRALELVSDGLGAAGRALRDLGEATQPPARGSGAKPATITGRKKAAATKATRKTA